jgi:hypothetical protein
MRIGLNVGECRATRPGPPILIPLGPLKAQVSCPSQKNGMVVGSFQTSTIKRKNLFIARTRKEFGIA